MENDIVERLRTAASNSRYQAEAKRDSAGHALAHAQVVGKNAVAQMHDEAADEIERLRAEGTPELREVAYDYAHLIQVERYDRDDIAVHRAYERLRKVLGHPVGLASKPYVAPDDRLGESRSYSRENNEG